MLNQVQQTAQNKVFGLLAHKFHVGGTAKGSTATPPTTSFAHTFFENFFGWRIQIK